MGYLMMCVLLFLCPRGALSAWCVERAVVALALASHAFKTGRRPSDATLAGAPTGGTR